MGWALTGAARVKRPARALGIVAVFFARACRAG